LGIQRLRLRIIKQIQANGQVQSKAEAAGCVQEWAKTLEVDGLGTTSQRPTAATTWSKPTSAQGVSIESAGTMKRESEIQ
jgi:hypothetical protein